MEQITLNLIPKGITPVCHASQYDKQRSIRLNIMDGLQGYILSDETVELRVRKPDNNIVTAAVEYTAGATFVIISTTEQMTACDGDNECELRLTRGEQRIGSLNFTMRVEKDPLKDGIESETEIHNLEEQVADIVANQYDSENVIFDETPTAGHGVGFAPTSGGTAAALAEKANIEDLAEVATSGEMADLIDVNINSPAGNQALVWNPTTQKWENGEVSTVGSIDDLNDVDTTGKGTGDSLRFDPDAGEEGEWVAQQTVVPIDEADYEDLQEKQLCTFYAIDDGSPLDYTAEDILYEEGGTETVHDKVESLNEIFTKTITIPITCRGYIHCYQLGKTVFVDININTDGNSTPIGTTIATGFPKPNESFYPRLSARDNNGSYIQVLNLDKNNGAIKTSDTVMQGNTWWGCQFTYFTND